MFEHWPKLVSSEPPSKKYRPFKYFEKIVFFTEVFPEMKGFQTLNLSLLKYGQIFSTFEKMR